MTTLLILADLSQTIIFAVGGIGALLIFFLLFKSLKKSDEPKSNEVKGEENLINTSEIRDNRYPALRTIAGVFLFFGILVGILAVAIAMYLVTQDNGIMFAIITVVVGAIVVLGLVATSETIKVFLDIEYNTRKAGEKK